MVEAPEGGIESQSWLSSPSSSPPAGRSSRFKDQNYKKPFAPLANKAVWLHSAEKLLDRERGQATDPHRLGRGPGVFRLQILRQRRHFGNRSGRRREERADSIPTGTGPGEARRGFRGHSRRGPPLSGRPMDHHVFEAAQKSDAAILAIPFPER